MFTAGGVFFGVLLCLAGGFHYPMALAVILINAISALLLALGVIAMLGLSAMFIFKIEQNKK